MKTKQIFIVFIIILLATTLLFPKTKEQKYCDQFSGDSYTGKPSENYLSCEADLRCKIDQDSLRTKEIDQDAIAFMCIPDDKISSPNSSQKTQKLPN